MQLQREGQGRVRRGEEGGGGGRTLPLTPLEDDRKGWRGDDGRVSTSLDWVRGEGASYGWSTGSPSPCASLDSPSASMDYPSASMASPTPGCPWGGGREVRGISTLLQSLTIRY